MEDDWHPIANPLLNFNPWSMYAEVQKLTTADVAVSHSVFPKYTVFAYSFMSVEPGRGSVLVVISLLNV